MVTPHDADAAQAATAGAVASMTAGGTDAAYAAWLARWRIHPREEWLSATWIGGSPAFVVGAVTHMTQHYMGGDNIATADTPRLLNAMQADYARNRAYDVGYSFAIDPRGDVWELRGLRVMAASDGNAAVNRITVSCLIMQPNIADDMNAAQAEADRRLMQAVREYAHGAIHWLKHRDVNPGTSCCGIPIGVRVDSGELEPHAYVPDVEPPLPVPTPMEASYMPVYVVSYGKGIGNLADGGVYEVDRGQRRSVPWPEWHEIVKGVAQNADGTWPPREFWQPVAAVANGWYLAGLPEAPATRAMVLPDASKATRRAP